MQGNRRLEAGSRIYLAAILRSEGDREAVEVEARRAIELLGERSPDQAHARTTLGEVLPSAPRRSPCKDAASMVGCAAMQVDFAQAARRHWHDGCELKTRKRLANADHLFGLAAECAIKALMVASGAPTKPDGDLDDARHRKHFNNGLWEAFELVASGRKQQRWLSKLPPQNPYADWSIDQRYAADSEFQPAVVEAHYKGGRSTMAALERAVEDGDIVW